MRNTIEIAQAYETNAYRDGIIAAGDEPAHNLPVYFFSSISSRTEKSAKGKLFSIPFPDL